MTETGATRRRDQERRRDQRQRETRCWGFEVEGKEGKWGEVAEVEEGEGALVVADSEEEVGEGGLVGEDVAAEGMRGPADGGDERSEGAMAGGRGGEGEDGHQLHGTCLDHRDAAMASGTREHLVPAVEEGEEDDEIKQLFRSGKKEKNNEKSVAEIALLVELGIH
ncbi:hypothetical protein Syun_020763 [Stephania yunnanensis]|uniref:Uncharacterized protein n=1 Tax=Stephania yunnanensis TaxID=152371 RepID=A0AAP0NRQ4_9MAGN